MIAPTLLLLNRKYYFEISLITTPQHLTKNQKKGLTHIVSNLCFSYGAPSGDFAVSRKAGAHGKYLLRK